MEIGYMTFGKKGAQPFVLLPGLSLKSVLGMAEFVEREYRIIGENYECFLFEPGMSVPEDITIEAMAECTKEAMDELGIKDFVLMGVSMGGMIAQELTLRYPEMVSKLILCSTADHIPESSRELINKWIGFAENRDGIGLCNAFAEHVYTKEYAEKYRYRKPSVTPLLPVPADQQRKRRKCLENQRKNHITQIISRYRVSSPIIFTLLVPVSGSNDILIVSRLVKIVTFFHK